MTRTFLVGLECLYSRGGGWTWRSGARGNGRPGRGIGIGCGGSLLTRRDSCLVKRRDDKGWDIQCIGRGTSSAIAAGRFNRKFYDVYHAGPELRPATTKSNAASESFSTRSNGMGRPSYGCKNRIDTSESAKALFVADFVDFCVGTCPRGRSESELRTDACECRQRPTCVGGRHRNARLYLPHSACYFLKTSLHLLFMSKACQRPSIGLYTTKACRSSSARRKHHSTQRRCAL